MPDLLVIGSINMDLVVRFERMPAPGETVFGSDFQTIPGGKGANQAVAASRLAGGCAMIGRVGGDAFGRQLHDHLRDCGVDVAAVTSLDDTPSGVAVISVDAAGENAITVVGGANGRLCPADVRSCEARVAAADAVVMQLETPFETIVEAVRIARTHGVMTVLDPAPAPRDGLPDELYAVDVISPNQSEAALLTGRTVDDDAGAEAAGRWLIDRGSGMAVIKRGRDGATIVAADGEVRHAEAFEVEAVDTTAAGDAFTAALAVALAEGVSREGAARFAAAAGALAVTKSGAQPAMPTRDEVERLARGAL